jgi:hypothetical protein
VFRVDACSEKFSTVPHHLCEDSLSVEIYERHVTHVHDAFAFSILTMSLFPIRFELRNPGSGEAALQDPSLFARLVGNRNSQHLSLRSQNEIAHAVPFLDSALKFLNVDGVSGDRTKMKIRSDDPCQRATARFVAACRFHGIEKSYESNCEEENPIEEGYQDTD